MENDSKIINGKDIERQLAKGIEGMKVSEEVLRKLVGLEDVEELEKTAQLKQETIGRNREKIPSKLAEEKDIIKAIDLPISAISNHVDRTSPTVTSQEGKASLPSSSEQNQVVLEKGVLFNHQIAQSSNYLMTLSQGQNLEGSMSQQAGETPSSALAEKVKEQFSKKIEGIEVSEEVLRRLGGLEKAEGLEKTSQQMMVETTGKDRERMSGELAEEMDIIKPIDLPDSTISNQVNLNQTFPTFISKKDKAGLHSSIEESQRVLGKGVILNHPITKPPNYLFFSLDLLAEEWFKANKASLISQEVVSGEVKTTRNLQSEIHKGYPCAGHTDTTYHRGFTESEIPQSFNHLMSNPLVRNIFNIQLNLHDSKDEGEEIKLLEEKINKILIEQAQRYGIAV